MSAVAFTVDALMLGFVGVNAAVSMPLENKKPRLVAIDGGAPDRDTAALLVRCAAADGQAFRQLYDANSARLYGVALRITRNAALASDAVHDAMLQVWRNAARYDPARGNADGWLVSLVRYRALDIIRKHGRETTGVELPDSADDDPDALSRLVTKAETVALRSCLEEVDQPRRKLLLLAFVNGLTQSEVADQVGQPLGTVKSTIRRALIALRTCLQRTQGPADGTPEFRS
jgi:RNA polymerase sigma-70 factor (ECF subfamily)